MKLQKFEFEEVITETSVNTVCALIAKEDVTAIFERHRISPKNDAMEPDNSYTEGEIQFNYDKDDNSLSEVLVFPTYKDEEGGLTNGDFVNVIDSDDLDEEYFSQADEELRKALENEQEIDK